MAGKQRIARMYSVLSTDDHLWENKDMWDVTMDTKSQPNSEAIYAKLDVKIKKEIDENDIWVAVSFL